MSVLCVIESGVHKVDQRNLVPFYIHKKYVDAGTEKYVKGYEK